MIPANSPFAGFIFFEGADRLPSNLVLDLNTIREWASNHDLISDPEFQMISEDRIRNIFRIWSPNDKLLIAISLAGLGGKLDYLEYPYVPVRALIQRELPVRLVYWSIRPLQWDASGKVLAYGEARFGFWVSDCAEEFCSSSNAKLIVPKFVELVNSVDVSDHTFRIETKSDGVREVTGEGVYIAKFRKVSRQFDVDIRRA